MSGSPKLVLVVVNKYWECDPVLAALLGDASPPMLRERWPTLHDWPRPRRNPPRGALPNPAPTAPKPRAVYALPHCTVEVWCVSDLLEHFPEEGKYQSSSERKAERLPLVAGGRTADLVMSVGTATVPVVSENLNGAVVAGTNVFAHDGDPTNPDSRWAWTFDRLIPSTLTRGAFATMTAVGASVLPGLVPPPRAPSGHRALLAQHEYVSLGDVNVSDYRKYPTADAATMEAFAAARTGLAAISLETTHAVIRATVGDRFAFVSGIVNRVGRFDEDVGGAGYNGGQNFAGAYNAGVALAWMLPAIDGWFGSGGA